MPDPINYAYADGGDGDADNSANWTPTGIPTANDAITFMSGTLSSGTVAAPVLSNIATIIKPAVFLADFVNDFGIISSGTFNATVTDSSSEDIGDGGDVGDTIVAGQCNVSSPAQNISGTFVGGLFVTGIQGSLVTFDIVLGARSSVGGFGEINGTMTCQGTTADTYDLSGLDGTNNVDITTTAGLLILYVGNDQSFAGGTLSIGDRIQLGSGGPIFYAAGSPSLTGKSSFIRAGSGIL